MQLNLNNDVSIDFTNMHRNNKKKTINLIFKIVVEDICN